MDRFNHRLADLLLETEAEMRRIGLWGNEPPPRVALQSLAPFCHDTMEFEQWLQWLFLPRMKEVVEGRAECPKSSDITPLAEYRFAQLAHQTDRLQAILGDIDKHINREGLACGA